MPVSTWWQCFSCLSLFFSHARYNLACIYTVFLPRSKDQSWKKSTRDYQITSLSKAHSFVFCVSWSHEYSPSLVFLPFCCIQPAFPSSFPLSFETSSSVSFSLLPLFLSFLPEYLRIIRLDFSPLLSSLQTSLSEIDAILSLFFFGVNHNLFLQFSSNSSVFTEGAFLYLPLFFFFFIVPRTAAIFPLFLHCA